MTMQSNYDENNNSNIRNQQDVSTSQTSSNSWFTQQLNNSLNWFSSSAAAAHHAMDSNNLTQNGQINNSGASSSQSSQSSNRRQIQRMDMKMQEKFSRTSEKYNVKVVLRGDTSTGKSAMLRRLRGGDFLKEYKPTDEIKTAHVEWKAKGSMRDEIMLEVWDVVDKANARKLSESLTLAHRHGVMTGQIEEGAHTFPLDATVVDVYQNAHAAIFTVDPSKKWTYEYALREIQKVPLHLPVAICLNFRDYPASKRILHVDDVEEEITNLFSESRPIRPFVFETSMLNNFGLKSLSTFLHVPFLCLKRMNLESQLKQNTTHIVQAQEALRTIKSSNSYEKYQRKIEDSLDAKMKSEGGNTSLAPATTPSLSQTKQSVLTTTSTSKNATTNEDALTFAKLSNTKIGEVPLVLASAAISSAYAGVSAVATQTPAELAENIAKNAKAFATLGLASDSKSKTNTNYKEKTEDEMKVKVLPQFSHLPGGQVNAVGGKIIEEPLGAMEKLILDAAAENNAANKKDFFDDDENDSDDEDRNGRDWDEDGQTPKKSTAIRMDGWDDSDDDDGAKSNGNNKINNSNIISKISSPTSSEYIRTVPKSDPFFGGQKLVKTPADKAKEAEEERLRRQREEIKNSAGLNSSADDIDELAKAFGQSSTVGYEEVKDPNSLDSFANALQPSLGFKTSHSQGALSSTDSASKKKKKSSSERKEKK